MEGERGFAENVELMLVGCRWHFVVRRLATTKAIHKTQASLSELHMKRVRLCGLGGVLKLNGVGGLYYMDPTAFHSHGKKREPFWKPVG